VLLAMWAEIIAIGICVVFLFIAPLILAIDIYLIWCSIAMVVSLKIDDDYLIDENLSGWQSCAHAVPRILWLSLILPRFLYQHFCKTNQSELQGPYQDD
jgi:hypothetical protein